VVIAGWLVSLSMEAQMRGSTLRHASVSATKPCGLQVGRFIASHCVKARTVRRRRQRTCVVYNEAYVLGYDNKL
jgi:hypothetical protein